MFEITGVDIPDGTYTATLESVEVSDGQFGKYRAWNWLVEVAGEILPLRQLTSANTGPASKSYQQLTALLGSAPKSGEKIEPPTGKRCLLVIGHNEKKFPTVLSVGPYVEGALDTVPR